MTLHSLIRPLLAAVLITGAAAASARTAADFFKSAPDAVMPLFDNTMRLIMLEYNAAGADTKTENTLSGKSSIKELRDDLLSIAVSDSTTIDIATVTLRGDTIIAVIETVRTPVADSSITFYNKDWKLIATPPMPGAIDFAAGKKTAADKLPPFIFVSAAYSPEHKAFRFTDNTRQYYVDSEVPEAFATMQKEIYCTFNGKKFIPAKK